MVWPGRVCFSSVNSAVGRGGTRPRRSDRRRRDRAGACPRTPRRLSRAVGSGCRAPPTASTDAGTARRARAGPVAWRVRESRAMASPARSVHACTPCRSGSASMSGTDSPAVVRSGSIVVRRGRELDRCRSAGADVGTGHDAQRAADADVVERDPDRQERPVEAVVRLVLVPRARGGRARVGGEPLVLDEHDGLDVEQGGGGGGERRVVGDGVEVGVVGPAEQVAVDPRPPGR